MKNAIHTATASMFGAFVVAAFAAFFLPTVVPSVIQLTCPVTCPGGTLSMELGRFAMLGESDSGGLGVLCVQPGAKPQDVGDSTLLVLTTMLTLPLGAFFYVSWRGPSAASRAWSRRWKR